MAKVIWEGYGFIQNFNLLSSHCRTASEHHPTSAWVVLRVDRWAQGKKRTSPPFLPKIHPYRPLPFPSSPLPPLRSRPVKSSQRCGSAVLWCKSIKIRHLFATILMMNEWMNEWMNNYSYRLGTNEHDKKWAVKHHMWTAHRKKWGSIDPLDPVAPRPLL